MRTCFVKVVDILRLNIILFNDTFKIREIILHRFPCDFFSFIFNILSQRCLQCRVSLEKALWPFFAQGRRHLVVKLGAWFSDFLCQFTYIRMLYRMACHCQSLDPADKHVFFIRRQSLSMGMGFLTCKGPPLRDDKLSIWMCRWLSMLHWDSYRSHLQQQAQHWLNE